MVGMGGISPRPGTDYSYTNNWPPEPLVGNRVTADAVLWSVLSLIALLGGIGVLFAAFGRWNFLGWHGREQKTLTFRAPGAVALTPAQRVCGWFFFVMAAVVSAPDPGGRRVAALPRGRSSNFFGSGSGPDSPVQSGAHLAFATGHLLGGHFLSRRRYFPGADDWRARAKIAEMAGDRSVVRAGRGGLRQPGGEFAGIHGFIQRGWSWFGDQGFEYLDLGRFWQILLTLGLCFWV